MMSNTRKHTYIGSSRNPFQRVDRFNEKGDSQNWNLTLIVGPFHHGSVAFKRFWRCRARKRNCRIKLVVAAVSILARQKKQLFIYTDDTYVKKCAANNKKNESSVPYADQVCSTLAPLVLVPAG